MHFASYGDPFFDILLRHLDRFALPACVWRIAVSVPGLEGVEMVGYAAVCQGGGGAREVQLIRAWRDLNGLHLAESETLTEAKLEPLKNSSRNQPWMSSPPAWRHPG